MAITHTIPDMTLIGAITHTIERHDTKRHDVAPAESASSIELMCLQKSLVEKILILQNAHMAI